MGDNTKIEWTDSTWTPIRARNLVTQKVGWHCVHASEGCRVCYAEGMNRRLGTGLDYKPGHEKDIAVFLDDKMLLQPLKWKRPRRIFVCSMTDMFADFVPDTFIDRMFAVMALCPQHTFQVLTKRPDRMRAYLNAEHVREKIACEMAAVLEPTGDPGERPPAKRIEEGARRAVFTPDLDGSGIFFPVDVQPWPLPNVWCGCSCEDQENADARIPHLLATPAAVRFLSCEPLLGPIDLNETIPSALTGSHITGKRGVDWVIAGGESGHNARSMHPDWVRSLRDQCAAVGVPFHFKQWGEFEYPNVSSSPTPHYAPHRVGKKAAGRLLDGVEHNGFPQAIP